MVLGFESALRITDQLGRGPSSNHELCGFIILLFYDTTLLTCSMKRTRISNFIAKHEGKNKQAMWELLGTIERPA